MILHVFSKAKNSLLRYSFIVRRRENLICLLVYSVQRLTNIGFFGTFKKCLLTLTRTRNVSNFFADQWGDGEGFPKEICGTITSRLAPVTFKMASKVFIEETDKNFDFITEMLFRFL